MQDLLKQKMKMIQLVDLLNVEFLEYRLVLENLYLTQLKVFSAMLSSVYLVLKV